jgi:signal peptidase I
VLFDPADYLYFFLTLGLAVVLFFLAKQNLRRGTAGYKVISIIFFTLAAVTFVRGFIFKPFVFPSESMVPTLMSNDQLVVTPWNFGIDYPLTKTHILTFRSPVRGELVVFIPPQRREVLFAKRCMGVPGDTVEIRGKKAYVNGELAEVPEAYAFLQTPTAAAVERIRPSYNQYLAGHATEFAEARAADKKTPETRAKHDWLGPWDISGSRFYLGINPFDAVIIARILDLPAAGKAAMMPKSFNQAGIWGGKGNRDWFGPYTLKVGEYWMLGDNRDNSLDSRYFGPVVLEDIKGKPYYRFARGQRPGKLL